MLGKTKINKKRYKSALNQIKISVNCTKNKKENEKNFISRDAWYRRIGLCAT